MKNTLVRLHMAAVMLSVAAAAAAQTSTVPSSVEIYSTVYSIGVEWSLIGDSNHNATASLSYRQTGGAWRAGLPLVRFEGFGANVLAGSVFFLTPGTNYEVQLTLSDPDGGTATQQLAVQTRPEPALPTNGRIFHVIPGSNGGTGSQTNPFQGITTAQATAQPGDILLLHQGNYGGRIEFNKAGTASQYLVWKAAGDGEVRLDGVDISASWVWLEGLTIRNQFYGLRSVAAPTNVVIRRLTFLNNHNSIFLDQRGEFWYIADNTIVGDTPYTTESFDGEGIELRGSSGHTIAHNRITNVADGISAPLTNVDIFGNDIFDVSDDGIEPDGGWINVRIWGNRIHNAVHNGISFQPQDGGPWYIIRNQIVGSVEAPFKFRQTDRFVMLHNTIVGWGNAYPGDALMCCNEDHLLRGITRNNLWINVQGGELWGFDTGGVIDWRTSLDYDGFDWGTHPHPFVYAGVSYATLPAFTAGTGLEAHGVRLSWQGCFETFNVPTPPPSSVPAQVMTLKAGCPAVDVGQLLPNIDDVFAGSAPDLGAVELGIDPPVFGPRPLPIAQLAASPSTITSGDATTLSWIATGATRATITPAVGVVAASGATPVSPTDSVTYTLFAENAAGSTLAFTSVAVTPASSGSGTPFNGIPSAIPGTIEAEHFNEGAANVAYRDLSPANEGGVFRNTGVDIEAAADASGDFNVGWVLAGEWLNYTVAVASTGTYRIDIRVAMEGSGGTFHLEVDHVDKTGPITLPTTGAWQTWTTDVRHGIALAAGQHVMRLVMDTNGSRGYVGNFNWFRWTLETSGGTPYGGTPAAIPGTIEAERFDEGGANVTYRDFSPGNEGGEFRSTDVDIESRSDGGTGQFNVGWALAGEWLRYTVAVASTGTYTLDMRVAAEGAGGTFHLEVDGVDRTGPITVPDTGSWQIWTTVQRTGITLAAGPHVMRLVLDTNGSRGYVGNFNWFRWTLETSGGTPYGGTPAAIPGTIEAERFDEGGTNVAYRDFSPGNEGGEFRSTDVDIESRSDGGTGQFNVGWALAGEWLRYTVAVASTGIYTLDMRVAAEGAGGTFHLEVDGVDRTGPITVPDTGSWQIWTTVQRTGITLAAGQHVMRLVLDTNGSTGYVGNFNWFRWTLQTSSGSTPYGGRRAPVPGTIEFERFDEGAANVAYRDVSPGNAGGAFRNSDVDIELTGDSTGDFNVGWAQASEWLRYSVTIAAGGFYTVDIRVAGEGGGGIFHLEVDGFDSTGPIVVPDSGAWTTVRRSVPLGMGEHMMSLVMDANGSSGWVGNFNWMQWSYVPDSGSRPYGGTPATVPGTIEVERYDEGGRPFAYSDQSLENEGGAFRPPEVDIEPTADVSGDFNVGWTRAGEWLLYTVDVTANGNYTLDMRVAAEGGGGTFHVEVDGFDVTGPVVVPNTGSWQSWTTVSRAGIPLTAGRHFMRLAIDANGPQVYAGNFNWLRWTLE